ncbi:alpha/beta hydrolase [Thiolapillus sp.]
MDRQFVSFENANGLTLKGLLFRPTASVLNESVGFIYLPGIVLGALSVHRLGFKVARELSDHGFQTLLFDQEGIGESEGSYPEGRHEAIAHWVAGGNLANSTREIIDWACAKYGMERIFLIGHCGGALTASYCAADQKAVAGVILISPPPLATGTGKSDIARKGVADEYYALYLRKLLDPAAWKRLLSGGTRYQVLATVLRSKVTRLFSGSGDSSSLSNNYNPRFVEAVEKIMRQQKTVEVIYGEKDPDVEEYRLFHNEYMNAETPLVILENTSHGFTTEVAQKKLLERIGDFARRVAS